MSNTVLTINDINNWQLNIDNAGQYNLNTAGTFLDRGIDISVPKGIVTKEALGSTAIAAANQLKYILSTATPYIYIGEGYHEAQYVDLDTLLADFTENEALNEHILAGYQAYDDQGNILKGTITDVAFSTVYYSTSTTESVTGSFLSGGTYIRDTLYIKSGSTAEDSADTLASIQNTSETGDISQQISGGGTSMPTSGYFFKVHSTATGNSQVTKSGWIEAGSLAAATTQKDQFFSVNKATFKVENNITKVNTAGYIESGVAISTVSAITPQSPYYTTNYDKGITASGFGPGYVASTTYVSAGSYDSGSISINPKEIDPSFSSSSITATGNNVILGDVTSDTPSGYYITVNGSVGLSTTNVGTISVNPSVTPGWIDSVSSPDSKELDITVKEANATVYYPLNASTVSIVSTDTSGITTGSGIAAIETSDITLAEQSASKTQYQLTAKIGTAPTISITGIQVSQSEGYTVSTSTTVGADFKPELTVNSADYYIDQTTYTLADGKDSNGAIIKSVITDGVASISTVYVSTVYNCVVDTSGYDVTGHIAASIPRYLGLYSVTEE